MVWKIVGNAISMPNGLSIKGIFSSGPENVRTQKLAIATQRRPNSPTQRHRFVKKMSIRKE